MTMDEPKIQSLIEEDEILKFTVSNIDVSIVNSLRRIVLSEIPLFVFKAFPHEENKINIIENTCKLHNEIIKQRLGCIPIHINDNEFPYKDYLVELDVKNDTTTIKYVTSESFKIKNINTGKYLSDNQVKKIFPPDSITDDYIEITKLNPALSKEIKGEQLTLTASLDISTAKDDGMYNVVSTCSYGNTLDNVKIIDVWNEKRKQLEKDGTSQEEIEDEKKNWLLLDAKRIFINNSFDFTLETIGVYSNMELVVKSCDILIQKCKDFIENLKNKEHLVEFSDNTLLKNEFVVTLENEDYTFGNVLTYFLYNEYYENQKTIDFIGFQKPHPHIPNSKIRIDLIDSQDKNKVYQYLNDSCDQIILYLSNLSAIFNQSK